VKPLPPSPTVAIPGSLDPLKSRTALFPLALAVFIIIIRLIIIVIIFHSAMVAHLFFTRTHVNQLYLPQVLANSLRGGAIKEKDRENTKTKSSFLKNCFVTFCFCNSF
jgi:hypothetical protein